MPVLDMLLSIGIRSMFTSHSRKATDVVNDIFIVTHSVRPIAQPSRRRIITVFTRVPSAYVSESPHRPAAELFNTPFIFIFPCMFFFFPIPFSGKRSGSVRHCPQNSYITPLVMLQANRLTPPPLHHRVRLAPTRTWMRSSLFSPPPRSV